MDRPVIVLRRPPGAILMPQTLRVLIDSRMLIGRFSGVARMVTNLVDQLAILPNLRIIALCGNEVYPQWGGRRDLDVLLTDFTRSHRAPARRFWWEATKLPHWIEQSGADVYHATWNSGVPRKCPVPAILTIHDLIPWSEPARNTSSRFSRRCYRHSVRSSLRNAERIITVSGFTAHEVVRRLRSDPARIRIIHNGVQAPLNGRPHAAKPAPPFLLYVGGHEPRKNVQAVFRGLKRYWASCDTSMELHLTGSVAQLDPTAREVYEQLANKGRIKFLGSPTDDQLAAEYAEATALLLLSRAEGFGLPVLEAMGHGCPVVAARCGALPEIIGNAGILVDPDNPLEVGDAIEQLRKSREEHVARGFERAAAFSWQRVAQSYLYEYKLAAQSRQVPLETSTHRTARPALV